MRAVIRCGSRPSAQSSDQLRPGAPGVPCGPAFEPGRLSPVGGDGVLWTDGGVADGPSLIVELGRAEPLPPAVPPPEVDPPPPPAPPESPVGDGAVGFGDGLAGADVEGGETADDVAGAVETDDVSVGASVLSSLLQPASSAADAIAADAAKTAAPLMLYVNFMAAW